MAKKEQGESGGREQWLERRRSRIGASEVSAIMGINPYVTPWEVWAEKKGILEPQKDNPEMRAGRRFEKVLLDEAEEQLGAMERDVVYVKDHLGSTLDGRVIARNEVVEAKTFGLFNPMADMSVWGAEGSDEVPQWYLVQIQAQLHCTESQLGHLQALLSGRGVIRYQIARSDKVCKNIREFVEDWWHTHMIGDTEPDAAFVDLDVMKRLSREPNKTIELTEGVENAWDLRQEQKAAINRLKKTVERIDAQILHELGDAEAGVFPDGRRLTYLETKRSGYTVEPTSYRVLREKKK